MPEINPLALSFGGTAGVGGQAGAAQIFDTSKLAETVGKQVKEQQAEKVAKAKENDQKVKDLKELINPKLAKTNWGSAWTNEMRPKFDALHKKIVDGINTATAKDIAEWKLEEQEMIFELHAQDAAWANIQKLKADNKATQKIPGLYESNQKELDSYENPTKEDLAPYDGSYLKYYSAHHPQVDFDIQTIDLGEDAAKIASKIGLTMQPATFTKIEGSGGKQEGIWQSRPAKIEDEDGYRFTLENHYDEIKNVKTKSGQKVFELYPDAKSYADAMMGFSPQRDKSQVIGVEKYAKGKGGGGMFETKQGTILTDPKPVSGLIYTLPSGESTSVDFNGINAMISFSSRTGVPKTKMITDPQSGGKMEISITDPILFNPGSGWQVGGQEVKLLKAYDKNGNEIDKKYTFNDIQKAFKADYRNLKEIITQWGGSEDNVDAIVKDAIDKQALALRTKLEKEKGTKSDTKKPEEKKGEKTIVKKGYNSKTNQTQFIYSDGTKEIVDGKK